MAFIYAETCSNTVMTTGHQFHIAVDPPERDIAATDIHTDLTRSTSTRISSGMRTHTSQANQFTSSGDRQLGNEK